MSGHSAAGKEITMDHIWDQHETQGRPRRPLRIPLGRLAITMGAFALVEEAGVNLAPYIIRHLTGDWGEMDVEDRALNDGALATGGRILSRYETPGGVIWIITEDGHGESTVLLPEEY